MGFRTTHVDLPSDDLWVSTPEGQLVRVQVKSSVKPILHGVSQKTVRYNYKCRRLTHAYDGVFIFVALDKMLCLARRWDDIPPITFKINPDKFTTDAQTQTIREAFT